MNVTAIIVTRGDHDLGEILDSLPDEWERIIWDNHAGVTIHKNESDWRGDGPAAAFPGDLAVYGRYAAIEYASHDLIYAQDDDCVVSDPQAIVDAWVMENLADGAYDPVPWDGVVCNMPPEFRHGFYAEHALVGFGAAFHRDAPARAFSAFFKGMGGTLDYRETIEAMRMAEDFGFRGEGDFFRTCDVVFTALTPRILIDVPKTNLPWAEDDSRMYRQPEHQVQRGKMLELAFRAKDEVDG